MTGTWKMEGPLELKSEEKKEEKVEETGGAASARAMFQKMNMSNKAPAGKVSLIDNSWKQHQSAITCLLPSGAPSGSSTFPSVSTTGMDGRLVMWDLLKSKVPAANLGL